MNNAWAPYTPDSARPWSAVRAAHLLRRAGFGVSHAELEQALSDGPKKTVDRLVTAPASLGEFERRMEAIGGAVAVSESTNSDECATLWLLRIAETPYPLLEKTTLFLHDHFAVTGARVGKVTMIERRLRLLRRHALGRFDSLLGEIVLDPATLLASGARSAPKGKPPLAMAATLLGRWTVGPGVATEADARDAARALTGASVLRDAFHFQPADYDSGAKRVLGTEGALASADVARIAAAHPATARHMARRLYRWFVSETGEPDAATVESLAAPFAGALDLGKMVETILRSNVFFSEAALGQRVRSPLEFAFGIVKAVGGAPAPAMLHREISMLGQRLLEPPTREGWAGGRRWLNQYTLVGRANLAATLVGKPARDDARYWWELLLQRQPPPGATAQGREAILQIVTSAEFQTV